MRLRALFFAKEEVRNPCDTNSEFVLDKYKKNFVAEIFFGIITLLNPLFKVIIERAILA